MSTLQRRIYGAVLGLHPAAFRNQFGREMMLDFDDALEQRGFPALIGDAFLSLARQWKEHALTGPELEQPVPSHPFLAGQYFMVDQGRLSAFTLARASLLSAMLLLTIGYSAGIPNRRIIANLQTVQVNHDGGIVSEGDNRPHTVSNVEHREAAGADTLTTVPGNSGAPFHGILLLRQEAAPLGKGTRASGGPPVRPVSLAQALRQLTMITAIVWLTSFLLRRFPGIANRVVLTSLGLLGIAASVAFGQVPILTMHAQVQAPPGSAEPFIVDVHSSPYRSSINYRANIGDQRFDMRDATLLNMITLAYELEDGAVIGGPAWIDFNRFDVSAMVSSLKLPSYSRDPVNSANFTSKSHSPRIPMTRFGLFSSDPRGTFSSDVPHGGPAVAWLRHDGRKGRREAYRGEGPGCS